MLTILLYIIYKNNLYIPGYVWPLALTHDFVLYMYLFKIYERLAFLYDEADYRLLKGKKDKN